MEEQNDERVFVIELSEADSEEGNASSLQLDLPENDSGYTDSSTSSSRKSSLSSGRSSSSPHSPNHVLNILKAHIKKEDLPLLKEFNQKRDQLWQEVKEQVSHHGILHIKNFELIHGLFRKIMGDFATKALEEKNMTKLLEHFFSTEWPHLVYLLLRTDKAGKINTYNPKPFEEFFKNEFNINQISLKRQLTLLIITLTQELSKINTLEEFKVIFRTPTLATIVTQKLLNPNLKITNGSRLKRQSREKRTSSPAESLCNDILKLCRKRNGWPESCNYSADGISEMEKLTRENNYYNMIIVVANLISKSSIERFEKIISIYFYLLSDIEKTYLKLKEASGEKSNKNFAEDTLDYIIWSLQILPIFSTKTKFKNDVEERVCKEMIEHIRIAANNTLNENSLSKFFNNKDDIGRKVIPLLKKAFYAFQQRATRQDITLELIGVEGSLLKIQTGDLRLNSDVLEIVRIEHLKQQEGSSKFVPPQSRSKSSSIVRIQWNGTSKKETEEKEGKEDLTN